MASLIVNDGSDVIEIACSPASQFSIKANTRQLLPSPVDNAELDTHASCPCVCASRLAQVDTTTPANRRNRDAGSAIPSQDPTSNAWMLLIFGKW